ncbi:hypothetical protein FSARC_6261 [Fusarium sarcochroum]|uniref:Uncharacterized protein n=1 Tax=Fusarium sarcochroum TaxID=1208366 RepID=A0A8H4TXK2_9HYPO|nr:hypothetical protein FSARC_6261 [Fusarium sarcochroum]
MQFSILVKILAMAELAVSAHVIGDKCNGNVGTVCDVIGNNICIYIGGKEGSQWRVFHACDQMRHCEKRKKHTAHCVPNNK